MVNFAEACLRMLRSGNADSQKLENALGQIAVQGQRAGHIIRHLRRLARKGESERVRIDLGHLVRADGADLQMADLEPACGGQKLARLALQAEDTLRDRKQRFAQLGQFHMVAVAAEQLHPEEILERLDVGGDARLAHAQRLGGLGEAALNGDRVERP